MAVLTKQEIILRLNILYERCKFATHSDKLEVCHLLFITEIGADEHMPSVMKKANKLWELLNDK